MDNLGQVLLLGFLIVCAIPAVIMLVAGYFIFRYVQRFLADMSSPSANALIENYNKLIAENPNTSPDQLVQRIINREAFKCGVVGLLTGVWGGFALPITLPVDFLLSTRIQAEMVAFIARIYGFGDDRDTQVATYIVMTGSSRVAESSAGFAMRFMLRIVGKSFSKLLPFIGAIISFVVNYLIAQSAGRIAWHWYARKYANKVPSIPASAV